MPTPSPEKIEFFKTNKATLKTVIEKENAERQRLGMRLLSETDIDAALDDFMDGDDIDGYEWPRPEVVSNPKGQSIKPVPAATATENNSSMRFEITQCDNGFVLSRGQSKFIFKNPKELIEIFNKMLLTQSVDEPVNVVQIKPALHRKKSKKEAA